MTMTDMTTTAAVILAAGKGTRIKAKKKNKVAFHINGKSMIAYTVEHLEMAGVSHIYAVVGFQSESVKKALGDTVEYVEQSEQLGTGHAVKTALPYIPRDIDTVLSVYGDDSAFYPPSLYEEMVEKRKALGCELLFLTVHRDEPFGLGRIVRDREGRIERIVEEKNATDEEKKITEINTGFYCFDRQFLAEYIDSLEKNPVSGEYYLTDMVEVALKNQKKVEALFVKDSSIWHGVNTRDDLAKAKKKLTHNE